MSNILQKICILIGLIVCLVFDYHVMFLSNFVMIPGDGGDVRLATYILNHWYNVFTGKESFFRLNFFYPDKMVLGYADAFFLLGIIYSFFRALGLNYFTSLQLLYVFMTIFGYLTSFLLFRKILKTNLFFSIMGSIVLASLNAITHIQFCHTQILGFYFYPLLIYLLSSYFKAMYKQNRNSSWAYIISFSVFLGLFFFTSWYPAYFFVFSLILFVLAYTIIQGFNGSLKNSLLNWYHIIKKHLFQLATSFFVFIFSLIPFLVTYMPVVFAGNKFPPYEVFKYSPRLIDLINVGNNNYIWSSMLNSFHFKYGNTQQQTGFPLIMLIVFIIFLALYRLYFLKNANCMQNIVYSLALTSIIIILLIIKIDSHFSLWYLLSKIMPGAYSIRALGRYLIVSQMLAVIFIFYNLNYLWQKCKNSYGFFRSGLVSLLIVISFAILFEQANSGYFKLNKKNQLRFLSKFALKSSCKYFFIKQNIQKVSEIILKIYQIDAMMISMKLGIPTLNGYSGLYPNKWNLLDSSSPMYNFHVYEWIKSNKINNNYLCSVDLFSGQFQHINLEKEVSIYLINTFKKINIAIIRYINKGYSLHNLYPTRLVRKRLLDKSFRGYRSKHNWTPNGFWIGKWGNSYAIGFSSINTDLAKLLYNAYSKDSQMIYFPFPKVFNPETTKLNEQGIILIVFKKKDQPIS